VAAWGGSLSVSSKTFIASYLLIDGVLKLALVASLLLGRLWAYPASLIVLGIFVLYQTYDLALTHSLGIAALTIFDCLVILLLWHEYRLARSWPNAEMQAAARGIGTHATRHRGFASWR
jgi:uncharacterized membrane protein